VSDDRIQNAERASKRAGEDDEALVRLSDAVSLLCAVCATHSQEIQALKTLLADREARFRAG
jgi:hypothetical protein